MASVKFKLGERVDILYGALRGHSGVITQYDKRIGGWYYYVDVDGAACFYGEQELRAVEPDPTEPASVKQIYVIGSLRNPMVPEISNEIRGFGYTVFDDWYAAGPEADDKWKEYEKARNRNYQEALKGHAAKNVFEFDKRNLLASDAALLVLPAGKSGHLELGWMAGKEKPTFVLLEDDSDRWDVMYQFATAVITRSQMKETFDAI